MRQAHAVSATTVAAALLIAVGSAASDPINARLEVDRNEATIGCPDAATLSALVEQRLQRAAIRDDAPLVVKITYEEQIPSGFRARVILLDEAKRSLGERELGTISTDCSELLKPLALVTALLVDAPPEPSSASSPSASASAPSSSSKPLPTEGPPRATETETWRVRGSLGGRAAWGRLPDVSPGLRLWLGARPPHFVWWGFGVDFNFPKQFSDASTGATAEVVSATVKLDVCPIEVGGRLRAGLCLGPALDYEAVSGSGLDVGRSDTRVGAAFETRVGLSLEVAAPLWLDVGLTTGVPLVRNRYTFTGANQESHELFRARSIRAAGDMGLTLEFP